MEEKFFERGENYLLSASLSYDSDCMYFEAAKKF